MSAINKGAETIKKLGGGYKLVFTIILSPGIGQINDLPGYIVIEELKRVHTAMTYFAVYPKSVGCPYVGHRAVYLDLEAQDLFPVLNTIRNA